MTDLLLVVEPNRQPDVFRLKHLSWADGQPVASYTLEGAKLEVPLPESLLPGAQVSLDLSFALDLPPGPGLLGYTPRQTNLGDWYPFVPPRHAARGWLVHDPGAIGEHLVYDVADLQVEIQLVDPRPDLTIAASGLVEVDENWHRYRLDAARSFAWSAGTEYVVITGTIGSITVTSYAFPEHHAAGEAALKTTADALALYTELFGPYPHAELVVVEAVFPDGMEYDGLYFLGGEYYAAYAGSPQGYLTAIAAHETAHQWWYGLVSNDQALEPWLDEALAIYSERLFYERLYPELVDWWWEFRVTRFNPIGWVDSTIYDHTGFRSYVDAVYLRGALFMEELRNLTGDAAFFAFLQDYVTHNAQAQATAEAFFSILAEHHPTDLSALAGTYFAPLE
ncbi:MAG: M1 family metallopeptidase [Anaerolineae bacterium]|nr:MAG: M1 family metallopeptidase [Anaerolineae bacterium]